MLKKKFNVSIDYFKKQNNDILSIRRHLEIISSQKQ